MGFITDIFNSLLSEVCLLLTVFVLAIFSMFYNVKYHKISKWIALFGVSAALVSLKFLQLEPVYYSFSEAIISDTFTVFIKALILISSFIIILLSKKNVTKRNHKTFQFYLLLISAVLSSLFVVSSNDFLMLTVSLEFLSFSIYFLIAYKKGYNSKESSFKYIVTNSFSTAIYLFGVSYLYGITSSFNFNAINDYFMQNEPTLLYSFAIIFISLGLLFKLAILPFANWVLDVYEGSATSVAAFIATVPKIAVLAILARLLCFIMGNSFELPVILICLAVVTAFWANSLAIRQKSILRIFACSSSANASYMLFALSLMSVYNLSTVLFYLTTYIFMNLGIFAAIIVLENSNYALSLQSLRGLAYSNPIFTLAFAICLFGLAGFPITSGFIAKLYLLSAIVRSGVVFMPLLIALVITMVIACYYYTKIVKTMFEKENKNINEILPNRTSSPSVTLYVCALITVIIGIMPAMLIELCKFVAYNL